MSITVCSNTALLSLMGASRTVLPARKNVVKQGRSVAAGDVASGSGRVTRASAASSSNMVRCVYSLQHIATDPNSHVDVPHGRVENEGCYHLCTLPHSVV